MMKKTLDWALGFALVALVLSASVPSLMAQEAPLKVAVVDVEAVVAESPQGKELQARLQGFQTEVQLELQRMQEEAQSIRQRIADGANSLSEDRLNELEKELEDSSIAIRRYRDDKQRQGQKMQEEGLVEIEKALQPVFNSVREEMGFDLILNRVPGVVLMISDRMDITPLIISRLNSSAESATE